MTPAENNTSNHSRHYDKFASLLLGHSSGNEKFFYNPRDLQDMYYTTCYMRDNEISYLNTERQRQYGKQAVQLVRLAYIGDGEFRYVANAREKIEIEKTIDADFNSSLGQITKSLNKMRL